MSYLQANHLIKAKDIIQGVQQFIAQDNTLKDKRATAEQLLNGAFDYLQQEKAGKAQKIIQEAIEYLENDEDVKEANKLFKEEEAKAAKLRGVKYLEKDEKDKVAAGVNKASLVDSFLQGALTYLEQHQVAKAIDIVQGIVLYVGQCDEIKDKAAAAEEMIQGALTYLEEDKLEKGTEMIREAEKYLENDEDFKAALGKRKGAKYLQKGNAEIGLQKVHFVEEVLKVAMSYLHANQMVKAKDVIQGVQRFIA
jgi:ribosomal protein S7